jgi:prephenate dehydrogenase
VTAPRMAAVLGLGLIGGSIARGLAAKGVSVAGFDVDPDCANDALQCGVLGSVLDPTLSGLENAEWVIIAVPVTSALELLGRVSRLATQATLITDTCSTKRSIDAEARRLGLASRFVGSHPMTGSEKSGWAASRADLFEGATTYLCAASDSHGAEALEAAENLWSLLGSRTQRITAFNHDRKAAATSHLPHVLSTTLAMTLEKLGIGPEELGPGGRDMVRIAKGDEVLWKTILLDNADLVAEAAETLFAELMLFRTALAERDAGFVQNQLARGREWSSRSR